MICFLFYFQNNRKARFYWDYDLYYTSNEFQEAGHYIRENLKLFPNELATEHFNSLLHNGKQIEYIAVPSTTGQAKLLSMLLSDPQKDYSETAIVLCDEQLLTPVLHSIPSFIQKINITMGFPVRNTTILALIHLLCELKRHTKKIGETTYYYYKPVMALLNHKLVKEIFPETVNLFIQQMNKKNIIYISAEHLQFNDLTRTIFSLEEQYLPNYLEQVLRLLSIHLQQSESHNNKLEKEFLFQILTLVRKMRNTFEEEQIFPDNQLYLHIINNVLRELSIPFSGEPIEGMQIMGLMETRMLDFKHLIFLSTNEGILPKGSHASSFIPYNLRVILHFRLVVRDGRNSTRIRHLDVQEWVS